MDEWEKFNEKSLSKNKEFYSNLSMKDITDADFMQGKRNYEDFEIKHLGEYHNFYLTSDTLFLPEVFKNFRKLCLEI